jgi:hypothetical protein
MHSHQLLSGHTASEHAELQQPPEGPELVLLATSAYTTPDVFPHPDALKPWAL